MKAPGDKLERFVGIISSSIWPLSYYLSVIWPLYAVYLFFTRGCMSRSAWLVTVPYLCLAFVPIPGHNMLISSWFFKCMLKYFDFEEILLMDEKETEKLARERNIIYAVQPHGVMSICGLASAVQKAPQPVPPTGAAEVLFKIPILRHVACGLFPLTSASKSNLVKILTRPPGDITSSVVLYIGGIAELFLCDPKKEVLFIKERKGFIKLALETGAAIVPIYMFGNTSALRPLSARILAFLSRRFGISLTLIIGRWGLPVPHPHKLLVVRGKALDIPKVENPSSELISEWHEKYVAAVSDIYYTYREKLPMYKNKPLVLHE